MERLYSLMLAKIENIFGLGLPHGQMPTYMNILQSDIKFFLLLLIANHKPDPIIPQNTLSLLFRVDIIFDEL
jgi:hypothetical protein